VRAKRQTITPDHIAAACELIAAGSSLRKAAKALGLNEASIRYHLVKDADAFTHSAHARELGCDALADECLEIADGDEPTDVKRVKIDTRIRLIGKWSQRYSDKLAITNKTEVTHRYDLDSLDDARLAELERILADASRGEGDTRKALPAPLH
jgi:hypothetical protein